MAAKYKILIDTYHTHLSLHEQSYSRYMEVTPTGRIKYKRTSEKCDMYLEVTYLRWTRLTKNPWYKKDVFGDKLVTKWVHDSNLILQEEPEVIIYGCTTKSTDD